MMGGYSGYLGVDYCVTHDGIRNEDMQECDMRNADPDTDLDECEFRPLVYKVVD